MGNQQLEKKNFPTLFSGKGCGCIYLDFSKALDAISHTILLEKLAANVLDG